MDTLNLLGSSAPPCYTFLLPLNADNILGTRGSGVHGQDSGNSRLLSTLLTEMDGLETSSGLLVIAATNRPGCLDHAFIRPGRLDARLFVPPPDLDGRHQILQIHTKDMPLSNDVDLLDIAEKTDFFTGIPASCASNV